MRGLPHQLLRVLGRISSSEDLFKSAEESPARTPLRCADANAGSVTDLVFFVEDIDHVEARDHAADRWKIETVLKAEH